MTQVSEMAVFALCSCCSRRVLVAVELGEWSLTYGYLDAKPSFSAKSPENGEIHFKFTVHRDDDYIWLCGQPGHSLQHAVFSIDVNAVDATKQSYQPSNNRVVWTKKKYVGFECKELSGIPAGTHVVSVSNNGTKLIELSHMILWER